MSKWGGSGLFIPIVFRFHHLKTIGIDWEHTELRWIAPEDIGQYPTMPKLLETWARVAE